MHRNLDLSAWKSSWCKRHQRVWHTDYLIWHNHIYVDQEEDNDVETNNKTDKVGGESVIVNKDDNEGDTENDTDTDKSEEDEEEADEEDD